MDHDSNHVELSCASCDWSETCDPPAVARWLNFANRLRRDHLPELEIMHEILRGGAVALGGPGCGATGLAMRQVCDADFDWPEARRCGSCGKRIDVERIAVVPDTKLCVACQQSGERGETPPDEVEFCPRCGAAMELRLARGAGIARYVMQCTAHPPCRLR